MSVWDKIYYYLGLAGLIAIPIVVIIDISIYGAQIHHLRGLLALLVFGVVFSKGRIAKHKAELLRVQEHQDNTTET